MSIDNDDVKAHVICIKVSMNLFDRPVLALLMLDRTLCYLYFSIISYVKRLQM